MNNMNKKIDAVVETKKFLDGLLEEDAAKILKERIKDITVEEIEACENDKELSDLLNGDVSLIMALAKCFEDNNKLGRHNGKPELSKLEFNQHRLEFMKDFMCYFKYADEALEGIEKEETAIETDKEKFSREVTELLQSQEFNRENMEKSDSDDFKLMIKALEKIESLSFTDAKLKSKGVKVLRKETAKHLKHLITKYIKLISPQKNNKRLLGLYRCVMYTAIEKFAKGRGDKVREAFEIVIYTFLKEIVSTKQITQEKIMLSNVFILALKHLQDDAPSKIIDMDKFKNNLEEKVALITSQL